MREEDAMEKEEYNAPELTVYGDLSAMTLGCLTGDADTPGGPNDNSGDKRKDCGFS
jgi:hypothetical protein